MNSLKWINGQIEECKQSIQQSEIIIDEDKKYPSLVKCHKERIEELKPILKVLEQIKAKLEAWEVVKNCLSISTDSWDEYSKSFEFISFTVATFAGIHPLLGYNRQEIESIKKALEVEDE